MIQITVIRSAKGDYLECQRRMVFSRPAAPSLDLAPPKPWRRFVPSWLRSLIWIDSAKSYDGFLSYSWKSDSQIAPVIQSVIQRFLCPWYKMRAKTVFRDLSCLPAGSSLEGELFDRIDRSTHLIVLASPEAADSQGMEKEARHWFSRPRKGQVLIIVSCGDCTSWEEVRDHLLPAAVRNSLTSEPLWVPLKHRRGTILANPNDHRLREELVEDLKQVLLRFHPGRDWGQLRGEERAQRRRVIAILSGLALLFLVLAMTAAGLALYAQQQRFAATQRLAQSYWRDSRLAHAGGHDLDAMYFAAEAIRLAPSLHDAVLLDTRDIQPYSLKEMVVHEDVVVGAMFSHDESRILTWSWDKTARLWDARIGQQIGPSLQHEAELSGALFSLDDSRILTWSARDNTARLWDARTGQQIGPSLQHEAELSGALFNRDESRILTWSADHTARLWDARTGQQIGPALQHQGIVNGALFNRDESRILSWSDDGTVYVWLLNTDLDFPPDYLELWIQTATGTEYDLGASQSRTLDPQRWHLIRQRYEEIASKHATICQYPDANQWLREQNEAGH